MSAPTIPALPAAGGDLDAGAALSALDADKSQSEIFESLSGASDNGSGNPQASAVGGTAGAGGESKKRGRGRPPTRTPRGSLPRDPSSIGTGSGGTAGEVNGAPSTEPEKLSKRAVARLPKSQLRGALVRQLARTDELERQLADVSAEAQASRALDVGEVDAALGDMIGEAVDMVDSVGQVVAGEAYAAAVALDKDERDRLVTLSKRVAKMKLPSKVVENSPIAALAMALLAITAGKIIAVRSIKHEIGRRQAVTPHAVEVAAARAQGR